MTIKNQILSALFYFMIQVVPATAGTSVQVIANDQPVSVANSNECSAQPNKKSFTAAWSQVLVDFNKGESFNNVFDVFKKSDLNAPNELPDNVDYDSISQLDSQNCNINEVPIPAAGWLFASALLGFITYSNRHRV